MAGPEIQMVDIKRLKPYENNARTHSEDQIDRLRASLREFGFVSPVLIDANMGIIAGHGRVEAAAREGITEVPCVPITHLTEAQKRAYILADNRLAELAGWDEDMLAVELQELSDMDFDIALAGFEKEVLAKDMESYDINDLLQEFDLSAAIERPIWAVIRTSAENKDVLEGALAALPKRIRVERSYE